MINSDMLAKNCKFEYKIFRLSLFFAVNSSTEWTYEAIYMIVVFNFDPVALQLYGLTLYWYGICFAFGVWVVCTGLESDKKLRSLLVSKKEFDHFITLLLIGVLFGAKLGYLFFYTPLHLFPAILCSPAGLSFHGAVCGAIIAILGFSYRYHLSFIQLIDQVAYHIPKGLFFGRIGNFLNSELWGRPTESNWGVIFQRTDSLMVPRYPSQLYEALGEGLVLWWLLSFIRKRYPYDGAISSFFLIGYGLVRFIIEQWRQPDYQVGFVLGLLTMGQILCSIMIFFGIVLLCYSIRKASSKISRSSMQSWTSFCKRS
jgi:phosphatidylglycerol:prolipoprotein diacylglycerol transferase